MSNYKPPLNRIMTLSGILAGITGEGMAHANNSLYQIITSAIAGILVPLTFNAFNAY